MPVAIPPRRFKPSRICLRLERNTLTDLQRVAVESETSVSVVARTLLERALVQQLEPGD